MPLLLNIDSTKLSSLARPWDWSASVFPEPRKFSRSHSDQKKHQGIKPPSNDNMPLVTVIFDPLPLDPIEEDTVMLDSLMEAMRPFESIIRDLLLLVVASQIVLLLQPIIATHFRVHPNHMAVFLELSQWLRCLLFCLFLRFLRETPVLHIAALVAVTWLHLGPIATVLLMLLAALIFWLP